MSDIMDVVITNIDNGKMNFHWENIKPEFEQVLKSKINVLGSNNTAYTPDILPQDKLSKAWGWVHGNCGLVVQTLWESGRQDAYVMAEHKEINQAVYDCFSEWVRPLFGTATDQIVMLKKEQDNLADVNVQHQISKFA
jgi:hypothetical protein